MNLYLPKAANIFSQLFLFSLLLVGCRKETTMTVPRTHIGFVDSAFQYVQSTLPPQQLQAIRFDHYIRLQSGDRDRFVLLYFKSEKQFLFIEKTATGFTGYHNRFSINDSVKRNGVLICENINDHAQSIFTFTNGMISRIEKKYASEKNPSARVYSNNSALDPLSILPEKQTDVAAELPAVYVYGGSGGSSYSLSSLFYLTNMNYGYYYSYTGTGLSSGPKGGGGGGYTSPANQVEKIVDIPTHAPGTKPVDIHKELDCFVSVNGATYMLRININQPEPNTREITNINADHMAGHTFLTLEQKNPDGSTTVRNLGWYPQGSVKPSDGTIAGQYQDDAGTAYCVSLSVAVSATEFNQVKNYLLTIKNYNVQTANCTNIAINAFAKAGVALPQTQGVLYGPTNYYSPSTQKPVLFRGANPADLGQDIRGMNATTLSQQFKRTVILEKTPTNNKTRTNSAKCR